MKTLSTIGRIPVFAFGFALAGLAACSHSKSVQGSSGAIGFEDEGSGGLPLVLLHSFGGDRSHWEYVRNRLSKTRRVISIDLRGHGLSATPTDGDFRLRSMAGDVETVLDFLHLKRYVLIGHSMGGSVALEYAGLHPDRVAGLVLVDVAGDPRGIPDGVRAGIKASLNSPAYDRVVADYWNQLLAGATENTRSRIMTDLRKIPRQTVISVTTELLDYDPIPSLKTYRGPALAITTPSNDGPFALHHMSQMEHRIVQNTGHWLHLDRPEEFEKILEDFLFRLSANQS